MADPRTRRSPRSNPTPTGKDELAGGASGAPTKGSGTLTSTPAVSRAHTPAPALDPQDRYADEDLQRATKLALELFAKGQEHSQANSAPRERALKARNPDLYYGSLYIEYYYFCWQCKDHFDTTGATGHQRVPFAASFVQDRINFRWQQHKTQVERDRVASLTWDKLKAFLRQSLGESTAFVNNIWGKIKRDSQYQQEEVQDWASCLRHFQSILVGFDLWCAPTKNVLCWYFYKGLRPLIWLWIDKEDRDLDS